MRLDWNYKGGQLKFLIAFQNVYLDLENCIGNTVPNEEKIGALNTSVDGSKNLKPWTSRTCESNKLQKTGGGKGDRDMYSGKYNHWNN
eukprot:14916176-Ditylum_brightwellii.AAC.1